MKDQKSTSSFTCFLLVMAIRGRLLAFFPTAGKTRTSHGAPSVTVSLCHQTRELGCEGISSGCGRPGTERRAAACLQSHRSQSLLVLSTRGPFSSLACFQLRVHPSSTWSVPTHPGASVSSSRGCQSCLFFPGLALGAIADLGSCLCPRGISAVNTMFLVCVQIVIT